MLLIAIRELSMSSKNHGDAVLEANLDRARDRPTSSCNRSLGDHKGPLGNLYQGCNEL